MGWNIRKWTNSEWAMFSWISRNCFKTMYSIWFKWKLGSYFWFLWKYFFFFLFFSFLFLFLSFCKNWNVLVVSGDINECALGTHNCDSNAICTNTPGSYTCACKIGYSGDGFTCYGINFSCFMPNKSDLYKFIDINECAPGVHNCDVNAICTNTIGSYTCTCATGYMGDGFSCSGNYFLF